ncbi:MAG: nicotinate-nucleotide adenylyltransferase [Sphingopyxis sp.]
MGGARQWPDTPLIATGLLGGSFNPAHGGHRNTSLMAMDALGLDALWWLVSPGNPLKPAAGMAPLAARLASAQRMARGTRISATAIERELGTRYTIDSLRLLVRHYPNRRFIWLMGADNLQQFHRWKDWRKIAALMPIAVIARPGYDAGARAAVAMGWLRAVVRPPGQKKHWTKWSLPALVFLRFPPDSRSATRLRLADPDWFSAVPTRSLRDPVTHHLVSEELI